MGESKMNNEKVKEIKAKIQEIIHLVEYIDEEYADCVSVGLLKDVLNLINELKSENEKLKQHKRELQGGQQDLTKRIAELEKDNERLKNTITCQVVISNDKLEEIKKECLKKVEVDKDKLLKQFSERLKDSFKI